MSRSWNTLLLLGALLITALGPARAAQPKYIWERMNVVRAAPSQVFARLGLTHNTRHGYTRDGFKKTDPDPTFPAGLTDVVPYDVSHVLLVRGTAQGLAVFRERVHAAEEEIATSGKWRVTVDLLPAPVPGSATLGTPIGNAKVQDIIPDIPFPVTVGDPAQPQTYQLTLHVQPNGAVSVTCQAGLLPTPAAANAPAVWTPPQVWTPAVSHVVPAGGTVLFDDLMAVKQAARQKLGLPQDAVGADFQVRVAVLALTLTPPVSVTPVPTPPASVVTPVPTPPASVVTPTEQAPAGTSQSSPP